METVENYMAADDARQNAHNGHESAPDTHMAHTETPQTLQQTQQDTQQDYYKSQQEVDQAFARRIAAERQKWEKERQDGQTGENTPDAGEAGLSYTEEAEFLRGVQAGEMQIRRQDPNFDLAEEMEGNPLFALMVAQGQDVKRVYDFFYPKASEGRLRKTVEKEIIERLRMRNNRPDALRSANAGKVHRDISGMSDNEIMDIDKRIKRGERVVL